MDTRRERDALGKKQVPIDAWFGVQTQRSVENFPISGKTLPITMFYAIAEIKKAIAQANMSLKLLEKKKGNAIVQATQVILRKDLDESFVVDAFQAGAGTATHMNVNEVIANYANVLLGGKKGVYNLVHPNDHANMGQSTNNVFPSAIKIALVRSIPALLHSLQGLEKEFAKKGKTFNKVIKSGRTHLEDAVPITLGQEFHAYATTIKENKKRLELRKKALQELNIGRNAIGTGINTKPNFQKKIIAQLQKNTKIPWTITNDPIYGTQSVACFMLAANDLRTLSLDLIKIANDIRLLGSGPTAGLREIELPAVQPGSSIMPGKVNPSMAEMLNMVAFQVLGNDTAINFAGQAGQLELNVMMPLIAKNLLESVSLLTSAVYMFKTKCVEGITANEEICKNYFERSVGLGTLLNPIIGYEAAAEVVHESKRTGKTIPEVVLERKLLTKKELQKLLDKNKVTKPNL